MIFAVYILTAIIFLLVDLSLAPYPLRPIFIICLASLGPLIIGRNRYVFCSLMLSLWLFILTDFEQAIKLLVAFAIIFSIHAIIYKKNYLITIMLCAILTTAIFLKGNIELFLINSFLTGVLGIGLYKLMQVLAPLIHYKSHFAIYD